MGTTHTIALVALAPLIQFVLLFLPAALISRWLSNRLPEGRLKRVLFYKL